MTYSEMIAKIRARTLNLKRAFPGFDSDGVLFELVNEKAREFSMKTKNREATPVSLAIVAGTRDYTISSAIAADVDEINLITLSDGNEIRPRDLRNFQKEVVTFIGDEDDETTGTPQYFRVVNGVLRITPTPSAAETATVYYTKKIATIAFTRDALAGTVEVNDEFTNALLTACIGEMYMMSGDENRGVFYTNLAQRKMEDAKNFSPTYDMDGGVDYHGL